MTRLAFLSAVCCVAAAGLGLAACASSSSAAAPHETSTPRSSTTARASTTTRPVTTTTRVSAKVADEFTQAALSSAIDAAHNIYAQSYDYTAVSAASLAPLLPNLHFGDISQAGTTVIGVLAQDRNDVLLATRSPSGHWYCIIDNATDGESYGSGTSRDAVDSNGECQAPAWSAPGEAPPPF